MDGLSKTERAYFNAAKAVSSLSDHRVHVGAVVVHQHRIISSDCNSSTRTDAIQAKLDQAHFGCYCEGKIHAESACLIPYIKRNINLSGGTIYVYREHKNGSIAMARPCERCMSLIKKAGIKKVYYSTESGFAKEYIEL